MIVPDQPAQKMWLKVCIFRIFCELPAEMGLGSRINTGVWRGTVEMIGARMRALTQDKYLVGQHLCAFVEMIGARMRALTHPFSFVRGNSMPCRNDRSPYEGIDTTYMDFPFVSFNSVEMIGARMRALTPSFPR